MGERFTYSGPVTREQLTVRQRRDPHPDCDTCGGEGVYGEDGDNWDCVCCTDVYRPPTPADLLTDPRVRALVEAAGTVVQYGEIAGDVYRDDLIAALAPFEVSDVG